MKKRICHALALLFIFCLLPLSADAAEMNCEIVIAPQYEEIGRFNDGHAPVKVDGKWGYINEAGIIVVEPKYDWAGICSEGVAVTLVADKSDSWTDDSPCYFTRLVDMSGKEVKLYQDVNKKFPLAIGMRWDDYYNYTSSCSIDVFFQNSSQWMCNDGIVCVAGIPYTKEGNVVRPSEEDPLYPYSDMWLSFEQTSPCYEGCIPMIVTEEATDRVDSLLLSKDGKIIEYTQDYSCLSASWDSLRMARKAFMIESDDFWPEEVHLWGLMDADMNWLAEPQFIAYLYTSDGVLFHDNLMPVQTESGKWGAINTSGELVINAQFDTMSCFNNGFSCVMQNGKSFFIDTNGTSYAILDLYGNETLVSLGSKVSDEGLATVYDAKNNKAYYVNLLAAHDGVVPAVTGSDSLSLESYVETFGEDKTPISMAIPSSLVPIKEGSLWGVAKLTINTPTAPFTDVPADSFCYEPVLWAVENNITTGTSATTFNPGGDCLRAQVVTFLWRAAGCPAPTTTTNPFVDVKPTDFCYDAVLWAVEKGITTGADASHFNPRGICNRAQVVTFLYRAFGEPAMDHADNPFADVPAGAWYAAPVLWAVEHEVTNGVSATAFAPETNCNRAQIVTFLYRAYS